MAQLNPYIADYGVNYTIAFIIHNITNPAHCVSPYCSSITVWLVEHIAFRITSLCPRLKSVLSTALVQFYTYVPPE